MPHKVYFVSSGPGDPTLLTLRGLEAIKDSPFILAPIQLANSFARYLEGKEVQSPFVLDRASLLSWINERLLKGNVALLAPGDFSLFCPFQSFPADFPGRFEVIPGVSAHVAAMAVIGKSMDVPEVSHTTLITSPRAYARDGGVGLYYSSAGPGKTLVLYMNDRTVNTLVEELLNVYPAETPIGIFEEVGSPDQRVTLSTLADIEKDLKGHDPFGIGSGSPEPALALVIVGDSLIHYEDQKWWNHRYEKIWKPRGMR